MALHERTWQPGVLIHHSDRGVQYASREYTSLLVEHELLISMSRRGSPYENARAERFMRTLKEEEVQGRAYENVDDARRRIGEFLEETYNRQRLHSALRYLPPDEFEKSLKTMESDGPDGNVGKPTPVSRRFHRPWKSLRDSHTSHRPDTTDVNTITKTRRY